MKKIITLILATAFTFLGYSQTRLQFCASVESATGFCYFNNNKFMAQEDSSTLRIFMEIKSADSLNTTILTYKIFELEKNGEEKPVKDLSQVIQTSWGYAWMPYNFIINKKYTIKVYSANESLVASKSMDVFGWK